MGIGEAEGIRSALLAAGMPGSTAVAIVENASLAGSRGVFGSLGELPALAASGSGGPALIMLGEVYRKSQSMESVFHERISA